MPNGTFMKWLK